MNDEEILRLWNAFDELGFNYEQIKTFALSLLLNGYKEKSYEELYKCITDCKNGYIEENRVLN
jgi:hypothetical protein